MLRYVLLCLLCLMPLPAVAEGRDHQYLFGDLVHIQTNARGNVRALAREVKVDGVSVNGDLTLAARVIDVSGTVRDDTHLLGETISLAGTFDGELMVAGRDVVLHPVTVVKGSARVAGERVSLSGTYKGAVQATGKKVYVSGRFGGDLHVDAEELTVQREAVIGGKLVYRGKYAPVVDDRAVVTGGYTHEVPEVFEKVERAARATKLGGIILLVLWPTIAGLFLTVVMRRMADTGLRLLRKRFWHSVGFGIAGLFGIPLIAAVLMISVVGLPFGVSLFASYPVALLLGSAMGALYLGDRFWKLMGKEHTTLWGHLLLLVTGVALLAAIGQIPYLGWFFVLLVMIAGVGGVLQFRMKQMTQKIDVK
jgi:cytoskeletal protein CcmA (bactofilin family)